MIKSNTAQVILFFNILICVTCNNSWKGTLPDGYLLGFKVAQIDQPRLESYYHHVSLFKIDFDGTVTEFWNFSLNSSDILFDEDAIAIDIENELVYLGGINQFIALDLRTGAVKIKIHLEPPNLQYFQTYNYVAKDKAIYGMCTGNSQFNWCRVKQNGTNSVHVEFLYQLPYTANAFGPTNDIYYFDEEEQTIWYYPSFLYEFAVAIDYTNAEGVFISAVNPNDTEDLCIAHDRVLDRVFTYIWNNTNFTSVGLGELFLGPKERKILIDLSEHGDLVPESFGSCTYDQNTHTFIGLMNNFSTDFIHGMPTNLLLMDTINLTYKIIPLPTFREKWDSAGGITSLKFIPHTL